MPPIVLVDVRGYGSGTLFRAGRAFSKPTPPRRFLTRSTVTTLKRNANYGIVDSHLTNSPYMLGEVYTIVDMAVWGWARLIPHVVNENALSKMPI